MLIDHIIDNSLQVKLPPSQTNVVSQGAENEGWKSLVSVGILVIRRAERQMGSEITSETPSSHFRGRWRGSTELVWRSGMDEGGGAQW